MAAKKKTTGNAKKSRRPGGQPGNLNAVKHGFYSARFSDAEVKRLGKMGNPLDVESELQLLRVVLGRVARRLELNGLNADGRKPLDEMGIKSIDRVVSVSIAIGSLIR